MILDRQRAIKVGKEFLNLVIGEESHVTHCYTGRCFNHLEEIKLVTSNFRSELLDISRHHAVTTQAAFLQQNITINWSGFYV